MYVKTSIFANVWFQVEKKKYQPLEVVGRGSETQLQMGENSNRKP